MKYRTGLWLLLPTLAVLISAIVTWNWLIFSESGARWLINRLNAGIDGTVAASEINGDLASGLLLQGIKFDDGSILVEADRVELALNIDLLPPRIRLELIDIHSLTVSKLQESNEVTDWNAVLAALSVPVPLRFEKLHITGFEFLNPSGELLFALDSIEMHGGLFEQLVIDQGAVSQASNRLTGAGSLNLTTPHNVSLDLETSGDLSTRSSIRGSLESAGIEIESDTPRVSIDGKIKNLLTSPRWELNISSPSLVWPVEEGSAPAKLTGLVAHSAGEISDYLIDLEGQIELEGLSSWRVALTADGDENSLEAKQLTVSGSELSIIASGTAAWQDQPGIELETTLERLDPGTWFDDWPQGKLVTGRLGLRWSGQQLEVSDVQLRLQNDPFTAEGNGIVDLESGIVDAHFSWSELSYPPESINPLIDSSHGNLSVSGRPEDWRLEGNLDLKSGEFPRGELDISGQGTTESFEATVHQATLLGGDVAGEFSLNWTGHKPFVAELAATDINVEPLAPEYPGTLTARLIARGELEPLNLDVIIEQLDGKIRAFPVSANGGVSLRNGQLSARELAIRSGTSSLRLNGSFYSSSGMEFFIDAESLTAFSNDFAGSLKGQGMLSLNSDSPHFSAELTGAQLSLGPVEIEQLDLVKDVQNRNASTLLLAGLNTGTLFVESASVNVDGPEPLQNITAHAQIQGTTMDLNLRGSIVDWADPLNSGWRGNLHELRLDHREQFTMALDEATEVILSSDRLAIERACFSGNQNAGLCIETSWNRPDIIDFSAQLESTPLAILELFADSELEFTQILGGNLDWSQKASGRKQGGARIDISPGAILVADDEEPLLETGAGLFGFELIDGALKQGNLDIDIPGTGSIDFDFSAPDLSKGHDSAIQGKATIDINDIGAVAALFPFFDTLSGVMDIDVNLSGTLSDPKFAGRASLADGRLEHVASGFSFSEINISGNVNEYDRAELLGQFRAGDGVGEVITSISFEDIFSPTINITLSGDSLTVIEVPDLKVIANPDISLDWRENTLEIDGRLVIPAARLSPSYLPRSSVPQSEDVVIVAGNLPAKEPDLLRDRPFNLRGQLEVELGEQVVIDLDMAQANVGGTTLFSWQDGLMPTASGSFNATGEIQAYGQLLRITQGRIGFPDIPADNPHLNIRAEREIFGNSQIRRAGLMVAGTLRRPVIEAYTVPMTNRDRAQTLLITGSDFDFEQGVGAVDVGFYILPRLYLSYGIGIFEDGNIISARYDLGRGFGVKATSGQRETGLDINYRIER
jgi:translocation and assembly module TamB